MPTAWQLAWYKDHVLPPMIPQSLPSLKLFAHFDAVAGQLSKGRKLMCQLLLLMPEGKTAGKPSQSLEVMSYNIVTPQCFFSAAFAHFCLPVTTPSPQPCGSHIAAHTYIQNYRLHLGTRYVKVVGREDC